MADPAPPPELAAFAGFLAERLPAVVGAEAAQRERLGLAPVDPASRPPLVGLVEAWQAGRAPGGGASPPAAASRRETILGYSALEQALASFLPAYTQDLAAALAVVGALRDQLAALAAADAEAFAAETATRAKQQTEAFLGMVSHELRTPIHILTGFCGILLRELAGPLTEAQRGYLGKLLEVARVLGRLVDDLIDLAQIGADEFSLAPERVAFAPLARETLAQVAPLAAQKELALVDEIPADLPPILADNLRLQQVLTNLLTNALKFTPAGGTVRVTARTEGPWLVAEVHDTGIGIDPADHEAIFERFVRRVPHPGGMGLGLAISRGIVAGHGGTIQVQSALGHGSVFAIRLPLAED